MFIRSKQVNDNTYYQMVEAYWEGGKPRQRTIVSLGQSPTVAHAIEESRLMVKLVRRKLNGCNGDERGELGRLVKRRQGLLARHEARIAKLMEIAARYDLETEDQVARKEMWEMRRLMRLIVP
jgi:hypothetical protein